jgi:hypothetical protein
VTGIVVQRCCLRIRRTAGWAWGDSPDALIAAASRGLPRLIAAHLSAGGASRSVHLQAPVRVRVSAALAELAALGSGENGFSTAAALPLADRLGAALAAAVESAVQQALASTGARPEQLPSPPEATAPATADLPEQVSAARSLRIWQSGGALDHVLAQLQGRALVALHDELFQEAPLAAALPEVLLSSVRSKAHLVGLHFQTATPLERIHARLVLAAALLTEQDVPSVAPVCAAIAMVLPCPSRAEVFAALGAPAVGQNSHSPPQRQPAASAQAALSPRSEPQAPPALVRRPVLEFEVPTALPFLLLPSLRHAGWLDAASTLLAAHGLSEDAFALAAALAAKVLDPPERGWLRTPAERRLLAAFAGRDEAFGDDVVQDAASRLAPILPLLDGTLRAALARARRPDAPLVLWRTPRGFSLFDSDGLPLLASAPTPPRCGPGELYIVPADGADAETLDALDLANLRFITDAPAARGEAWRRVAGIQGPLWTNDTTTPGPRLAALTADFEELVAHVAELAGAIEARPALPREASNALDASASLAATSALGDIAARLFPAERTTPVLALSRFRNLDAHVRIDADCVRVRVPLGQRHADLLRHGFLTSLTGLPWLRGRSLDLGGA